MGFLLFVSRKMYLTQYVNSLQSKLNSITEQKLALTNTISEYITNISDISDPDSPAVKKLQAKKAELEALDKKLDAEMNRIQTQLAAANTELQAADQALSQSIQTSFAPKYYG